MNCTRCQKQTGTNEFRMPFQANNDFVCDPCWKELREYYGFWKNNIKVYDDGIIVTKAKQQIRTLEETIDQKNKYLVGMQERHSLELVALRNEITILQDANKNLNSMWTDTKKATGNVLAQKDAEITSLRRDSCVLRDYVKVLEKNMAQKVLDLGVMTQDRDSLLAQCEERRTEQLKLLTTLEEMKSTVTGDEKELATKIHGLTMANEIWHDKVKQLEQSLVDVTHDRDTILARLQKLEETHKHCEANRKHLSEIIDWINK